MENKKMKKFTTIATLFALMLTTTANADDSFNQFLIEKQVTISNVKAKETKESKPDMFRSTIEFSETDKSAEDAQMGINKQIASATKIIKSYKIEYEVGNFNTYKEYKTEKHTARQTLTVESNNKEDLEKLVTALQMSNGKVTSTTSYLSEEMKKQEFETLFAKAYAAAYKKAEFITKSLNAASFTVTNIDYFMNENSPRPIGNPRMMTMKLNSAEDANIELDNSNKEIWLELNMSIAISKNKPQ
jgi:uncharacterized protein YggE